MKVLLITEPNRSLHPYMDTSVLFAIEFLRRGIPVDYADITKFKRGKPTSYYLSNIPAQEIKKAIRFKKSPFTLGAARKASVGEYQIVLQRPDPPVNEKYVAHMKHFAKAPRRILQLNSPKWNWRLDEHYLPRSFPKVSVPTYLCKTASGFEKTVKRIGGEVVAKLHAEFAGRGIRFLNADMSAEELRRWYRKNGPNIIVQPFLPEISTHGDLRVVTMNRKIMGWVLRVPPKGGRLANLHAGGHARKGKLTGKQRQTSMKVAKALHSKGLHLLGLDFIGDKLTEVNITCPTTIPEINRTLRRRADRQIVTEIVALSNKLTAV